MRRLVLIVAVISGLLCVGFIVASVCVNEDSPVYILPQSTRISLQGDGLQVWIRVVLIAYEPYPPLREFAGFVLMQHGQLCTAIVPYWFLIGATAVLPLALGRWVLTRYCRQKRGLCLTCGYDLRESNGRCPECGAAIFART